LDRSTQKGIEFCNRIIVPYEKVFPMEKKQQTKIDKRTIESGAVEDNENKSGRRIITIS
jgi:hypothetical protein